METTDTTTATVVLIHGAWHGAWCWDRVVPRLEAEDSNSPFFSRPDLVADLLIGLAREP